MKLRSTWSVIAKKILLAVLPGLTAGGVCAAYLASPNFQRRVSIGSGLAVFDLLTLARAVVMSTAGLLLAWATIGALRDWRERRRPTWFLAAVGAIWLGFMLVLEPFFGYLTLRVGGIL